MDEKRKSPPKFKTEAEGRRGWQHHDSTTYVDWRKADKAEFPNLRPSGKRNLNADGLSTRG